MSEHFPDSHHDVESNTVFGFWIYLMTDFILFATLFAVYAVLKDGTAGGPTSKDLFSLPYALAETLLLLSSTLTCAFAMLAVARGEKKAVIGWYAATIALGALFLAMVAQEFSILIGNNITWQTSAFLSSYFTLVGTHALHIVFGVLFTFILLLQVAQRGLIPITIRRLVCLKLFWFFSYMVWIFMFAFIYLMGVH